jgi:hypothetical protein
VPIIAGEVSAGTVTGLSGSSHSLAKVSSRVTTAANRSGRLVYNARPIVINDEETYTQGLIGDAA